MEYSISEIARILDLPFQGNGNRIIRRVAGWEDADNASLVFLERSDRIAAAPSKIQAGCIIAPPDLIPSDRDAIVSDTPKLHFARAAALLAPPPRGTGIVHPTAVVSPTAGIGEDVDIGPYAHIGADARIGRGSVLHAGVVVGERCVIGKENTLHPRVVLYPGVELGDRVVLHAGAIIGGDGFGYVFDGRDQIKFPQAGGVVIEDDVEIGCNTTIDRGSLGTTRIAAGAKIDNLVQIAHNVQVGRAVVIAAQTGISGSTVIEDYVVIGGQVGLGDHARVQSRAVIGSKAGILPGKIVRGNEVYWGVPVRPLREYKRLNALFGRLPEMKAELDRLKESVSRLEKKLADES